MSDKMAKKISYRGNNTYLIEGNVGDNPKLMAQALNDGRDSLYLEFYFGFTNRTSKNGKPYKKANRRSERLNLYLWRAPRTPQERQQNRETLATAKKLRFERGQQMLENAEGYRLKKDRDINLHTWMQSYYETYTKADKREIKRACRTFADFLSATPRYEGFAGYIKPDQLTKEMVVAFSEYLQHRFRGEGPYTVLSRFKKMMKAAAEADVIRKNPASAVSIKVDNGALKKDVLSIDEIQQLIATHYPGENVNIRRAFIFCLYCGLRWCDVKDLTFANVDYGNRLLKFEQAKTKGHSAASNVVIPLNTGLLTLIGHPSSGGRRDGLIFPLPSHNMCLKALRRWTERAGIDKHITWHCARHSFAVNILNNGANIKTVASLLGHSGLRHTEKYTRAVDSLKEAAINSLPPLEL